MKKARVIIGLLLVLTAALAVAAGTKEGAAAGAAAKPANLNATGYPIVNERITLKAMNSRAANAGPWGDDMAFLRAMKKLTNVDFEFSNTPATDWQTKMNLSLAAGDLPDVYMSTVGLPNIYTYGIKGKVFVDFSDRIKQYMPFLQSRMKKYPDMLKVVTQSDGGIYSFPRILITATAGEGNMYVRTDYMKAAGIAKEPATVDEFYAACKAIQDRYKGDKDFITFLPYTVDRFNSHWEYFMVAALGDYVTGGFNVDKAGKVFYNGITDQFRRYLELSHRLFAEKILSSELYTMNAATELALISEGKTGVTTYGVNFGLKSFPSGNYDVSMLGPLTSPYTQTKKIISPNVVADSMVVITNKCKNVEALLRWYDIYYSEEDVAPGLNSISPWQGIRGETWDFTDSTKQFWKRLVPAGTTMDTSQWIMTYGAPQNYLGLDFMAIAAGGTPGNELKGRDSVSKVFPYLVARFPLDSLKFTDAELKKYTTAMTDIDTYVKQMKSKFVTGIEPLSNFDSYAASLQKIGLDTVLPIIQAAYDRYNK